MKPESPALDVKRRRTCRFVILSLAVAALAFLAIAAGDINDFYDWTPTDLRAAGNKAYGATIRPGGMAAGTTS